MEFQPTKSYRVALGVVKPLAVGFVVLGVAALAYAELVPIVQQRSSNADAVLSVILVFIVILLGFYVLRSIARQRPAEIHAGVLSLEHPVRRIDGSRTRIVALREIVQVQPNLVGGYPGIQVTLQDGASFFLDWYAFGSRGIDILEALCRPFGISFLKDYRRLLLDGSTYRFQIARIRRVSGPLLYLYPPVRTNERVGPLGQRRTRTVALSLVKSIEGASPSYAGRSLLVTLGDWTMFLIPEDDADAHALLANEDWRSKLVES